MSDQELQQLVEQVSLSSFHRPFCNRATFNARLKTTGGRFHLADENLDFNPAMFAQVAESVQIGIIKHELCHYHLYRLGRGYHHRDRDFKLLLAQVHGLRYAPAIKTKQAKYLYRCTNCGQLYPRQRRLNIRRYACGRCRGKLAAVQVS